MERGRWGWRGRGRGRRKGEGGGREGEWRTKNRGEVLEGGVDSVWRVCEGSGRNEWI
jgi:hypothetical protein